MILIITAIFIVSFCLFLCAYGVSRWVLLKNIDGHLACLEKQLVVLDTATREMSQRLSQETRGTQVP